MSDGRRTIRAILLDADGVIQHATDDLDTRVEATLGFRPEPFEDFIRDVFTAERPSLTGAQDVVEALEPVLERGGAPGKAAELVRGWWCSIDVDARILSLVAELRAAGHLCALATNQQEHRAAHMSRVLGYDGCFDHSFYSCRVGHAKPDARYFEVIAETLQLPPQQLLFLDDHERNVEGAQGVGLHAERFVHGRRPDAVDDLRSLLQRFDIAI